MVTTKREGPQQPRKLLPVKRHIDHVPYNKKCRTVALLPMTTRKQEEPDCAVLWEKMSKEQKLQHWKALSLVGKSKLWFALDYLQRCLLPCYDYPMARMIDDEELIHFLSRAAKGELWWKYRDAEPKQTKLHLTTKEYLYKNARKHYCEEFLALLQKDKKEWEPLMKVIFKEEGDTLEETLECLKELVAKKSNV